MFLCSPSSNRTSSKCQLRSHVCRSCTLQSHVQSVEWCYLICHLTWLQVMYYWISLSLRNDNKQLAWRKFDSLDKCDFRCEHMWGLLLNFCFMQHLFGSVYRISGSDCNYFDWGKNDQVSLSIWSKSVFISESGNHMFLTKWYVHYKSSLWANV